jgi:hypothetical protein
MPDKSQMYQTIIVDDQTDASFFFYSVPSRSLLEPSLLADSRLAFSRLGVQPTMILTSANDDLEFAIANLLRYARIAPIAAWMDDRSAHPAPQALSEKTKQFGWLAMLEEAEFARYLVVEPAVPFENSPLSGLSLHDIAKSSGVAVGAYIGCVMAGNTPLLLVTVPAGMVICGVASGVAHGLEEMLYARIKDLMKSKKGSRGRKPG